VWTQPFCLIFSTVSTVCMFYLNYKFWRLTIHLKSDWTAYVEKKLVLSTGKPCELPDCWIVSFGVTDCICQQLNSLAAGQLSCNWWCILPANLNFSIYSHGTIVIAKVAFSLLVSISVDMFPMWIFFWVTEAKVTFLGVLSILYSVSFSVCVYKVRFHVALVLTYWRTKRRKCCSLSYFYI
jgi:hypothetical protein